MDKLPPGYFGWQKAEQMSKEYLHDASCPFPKSRILSDKYSFYQTFRF
ncbi:conserved hypothetical protein [Escherichia coli]|nr:hypothetical protein [Klebsiella pneumoniae IS22]CTQ82375.1 conserved hypothetical protein [Escherichia coli]VEW02946.1 conserved hypothetical protein [Escherichia coli]